VVTLVFVAVILAAVALDVWVIRPWTEKHRPRVGHSHDAPIEIVVPRTLFFHPGHTWARLDDDGKVTVGVDDLVRTVAGDLSAVELPAVGNAVRAGDRAMSIRVGPRSLALPAPVGGTVSEVNAVLGKDPVRLRWRPYKEGWAFRISPGDSLSRELAELVIGRDAQRWMRKELDRLSELIGDGVPSPPLAGALAHPGSGAWALFNGEATDVGGEDEERVA
jgi:glycine cleavage system H protein